MKAKLTLTSAAVLLACCAASSVHAGLERVGPVERKPTVGGFASWFQDKTGITLEFCDLTTQAEWDGGWCLLAQPDGPAGGLPEVFPTNFFDEHFYYAAESSLEDTTVGRFRARLVMALEAAFAVEKPIDGDQVVFTRHRLDFRDIPFDGDYRVITPYMDVTFRDQVQGDRIFETIDIGIGCPGTFECTLDGTLGPFLLPSATPGGAELPPMPDLLAFPGLDPFFNAAGRTPDPGTGKKYLADPSRVGPVTGSPMGTFTAHNRDGSSTPGRDHNIFRIEVRAPSADGNGPVIYTIENANGFSVMGRLMNGTLPGKLVGTRAVYKADSSGKVTDMDVFATAAPTVKARLPGTPKAQKALPSLSVYTRPCAGAIGANANGDMVVNPPPYSAPSGEAIKMESNDGGTEYWGQASTGELPPSHVCIVDTSAQDFSGNVIPAYTLRNVTDDIRIPTASFDGPLGGTLVVQATSSDPTAVLTLAGYGPGANGSTIGIGQGTGVELVGGTAKVHGLKAPPARVQVVSTKGGNARRYTDTKHGATQLVGPPVAVGDSLTVLEDCTDQPASGCPADGGVTIDLLANDSLQINGTIYTTREVIEKNLLPVEVRLTKAATLGTATVSNGFLKYRPNPDASGIDSVGYKVSVPAVETVPDSNEGSVLVQITPVNDAPVAGSATTGAVAGRAITMNLLSGASDPDGASDLRNAQITTWPAGLGAQPAPVNGVVSFVPPGVGSFTFDYRVVDAGNVASANVGKGTVGVVAQELLAFIRARYTRSTGTWVLGGTDRLHANQTITIAYTDGTLAKGAFAGQTCNGTAAIPDCVVATLVLGESNSWLYNQRVGRGGAKDPSNPDGTWSTPPSTVRAFSSSPELGGSATMAIQIE